MLIGKEKRKQGERERVQDSWEEWNSGRRGARNGSRVGGVEGSCGIRVRGVEGRCGIRGGGSGRETGAQEPWEGRCGIWGGKNGREAGIRGGRSGREAGARNGSYTL